MGSPLSCKRPAWGGYLERVRTRPDRREASRRGEAASFPFSTIDGALGCPEYVSADGHSGNPRDSGSVHWPRALAEARHGLRGYQDEVSPPDDPSQAILQLASPGWHTTKNGGEIWQLS